MNGISNADIRAIFARCDASIPNTKMFDVITIQMTIGLYDVKVHSALYHICQKLCHISDSNLNSLLFLMVGDGH